MKPRLHIEQKITPFVNKYKVFATDPDGGSSELLALAQQKRLAFKEKVTFYGEEEKTSEVFTFRAEKVFDVHGRYLVEDMSGTLLGSFKKEFKQSLLNSTWKVFNAEGAEVFMVRESSTALALFRRYAGFIPIVGDIIEIVTAFLKYHFVFTQPGSEEAVGKYQKTKLFRDHYTMHMNDTAYESCDWRVLAAFGVGLDALQSR